MLDNFCNSRRSVLGRIGCITGNVPMHIEGDVRDVRLMERVFAQYAISGVIHFAALKSVGESTRKPLQYYDNNVTGAMVLLRAMQAAGVRTLVFSSSATVYGEPASVPVREDFSLSATNPHGRSKLMVEQMLADVDAAEPGQWRLARLRYFNPVGAHGSGLIGEDPQGVQSNLLPYVAQVAAWKRATLRVHGNDYPTPDGTGVRDYIHLCDLVDAHVAALRYLAQHPGMLTVNVGTGRPVSVMEMVRAFERASGRTVTYQVVERRPGDVAQYWADPTLAERRLGWRAEHDIHRMC